MARRNRAKEVGLTKERLEELYREHTDAEIGVLLGMSDVAISYFRRKYGIPSISLRQRRDAKRPGQPVLDDLTPAKLADLHSSLGQREIGVLYGVSKPTISMKLKEFGIPALTKSDRSTSHEEVTGEQKEAFIGVLLGDGHLLERGVFKVSHYQEQIDYLRHLHKLLFPHALPIRYEEKEMKNGRLTFGFGFQTVQHEWLRQMRAIFYPEGVRVFPESVLKELTPRSLAYWYFDDGHLGDGLPTLAVGDVKDSTMNLILGSLRSGFQLDVYERSTSKPTSRIVGIRARSADSFFNMIREHAPSDMLYKFPAKYWRGAIARQPVRTKEPLVPSGLVAEVGQWPTLDDSGKETLVEAFSEFWLKTGFPYHVPRPEELTVLLNLDSSHVIQDGSIKARQAGQGICQGIMKHIWSASSFGSYSPRELFSDPLQLRELIRFILKSGDVPNPARMRAALRLWKRSGVYNFRPSAAKALVDRFCCTGGTVLDPCAGYGGRLLGTLLSNAQAHYVGYDPSTETHAGLLRLNDWVRQYLPDLKGRVDIRCEMSEEATFPENVDMILTSPPYWCREEYSLEESQSGRRYGTYEDWLNLFWRKVLEKSVLALKPGGWLVVNVDDFRLRGRDYPLVEDTLRLVAELGLGRAEKLLYDLPGPGTESRSESVLCWVKGVCYSLPNPSCGGNQKVSSCSSCGKATPSKSLTSGLCKGCLTPKGSLRVCKGCGIEFKSATESANFHSAACYARYRRRLLREKHPVSEVRKFTCSLCGSQWETKELGNFKYCPACQEARDLEGRVKKCGYRYCGVDFTDTSPKNSMTYCCPEHRRREKLLRSGLAKDESYFRKPGDKRT